MTDAVLLAVVAGTTGDDATVLEVAVGAVGVVGAAAFTPVADIASGIELVVGGSGTLLPEEFSPRVRGTVEATLLTTPTTDPTVEETAPLSPLSLPAVEAGGELIVVVATPAADCVAVCATFVVDCTTC